MCVLHFPLLCKEGPGEVDRGFPADLPLPSSPYKGEGIQIRQVKPSIMFSRCYGYFSCDFALNRTAMKALSIETDILNAQP